MPSRADAINALFSDPNLTRCSRGHDHRAFLVKGSLHEQAGPGKRALFTFHCPECGSVTARTARPDYWQEYPTIQAAQALGHVLPCGLCFPLLAKKFNEALRQSRK